MRAIRVTPGKVATVPAASTLVFSLVTQVAIFGVNGWAVGRWVRATRTARVPAAAPLGAV